MSLLAREEVGTYQSVEVDQDHDVHEEHGDQEVACVVQPAVVLHDEPGEVKLGTEAEAHVGEEVEQLVDAEERRELGPC